MGLGHRFFRSLQAVQDEFPEEPEAHLARDVEAPLPFPIDEVDVVAGCVPSDIEVLSELDRALGADDKRPAVAPAAQAVRREPIDPHIAQRPRGGREAGLAEVLQLRLVRVVEVADCRVRHRGVLRSAVREELLVLVAAEVAQDPPVLLALEEPGRSAGLAEPVRRQNRHVDDPADGSLLQEIGREHGGLILEPLAVVDHVLAARLGGDFPRLVQLPHRGERRLVGKVVLARLHHLAADRPPLRSHGVACDEADLGIVQDLLQGPRDPCLRELGPEGVRLPGIGVVDPLERGAGLEEAVAHAVNVPVVQPHGGHREFSRLHDRARLALRGVVHAVGLLERLLGKRAGRQGAHRHGCSR